MKFVTKVVDKQVVVHLVGDVDASNPRSFRRYLVEAADIGGPVLLLDLLGTAEVVFHTCRDLDEGLRMTKELRDLKLHGRLTRLHDPSTQ